MQDPSEFRRRSLRLLPVVGLATLAVFSVLGVMTVAHADPFLPPGVGYLDFTYEPTVGITITAPTGEKPESKLWWNDGLWWGSLYNRDADAYHIYWLDWGSQTWRDTGVALDDRRESKADILWDAASGKLYVASHLYRFTSQYDPNPVDRGRLYRYTYNAAAQTYSLDPGFPVMTVNRDKTETLVLAKDSTGRLWVTYVSAPDGTSDFQVYVNATTGTDQNWGTPFTLSLTGTHVLTGDIASIVAFQDNEGAKIGIMWSNRLSDTVNFATHLDSNSNAQTGWTLQEDVSGPNSVDDHISLKADSSGQVFAAIRTNATVSTDTLIALVARDISGTFSIHPYSTRASFDTRPIVSIDESANKVYVFVAGGPAGNRICYKAADITSPLSNMSFSTGDCGTDFVYDSIFYNQINNPTTAKQSVNITTGIAVLASDDTNGSVYAHNVLGNPPPVVTDRSPERNATNVLVTSTVRATFSKPMNGSTLNATNFTVVSSGGAVAGTRSYDAATRTATFTPTTLLAPNTRYTVTLTSGVQDTATLPLFGAPEVWSFTTALPSAQFSAASYSVNESAGTATITVTLNTTPTQAATVTYATSNGTAIAGSDYTTATNVLTFNPGQTSRNFTVSILNDVSLETNETVNLTLSSPGNATLGTPMTATLTIVDNDGPPTIQFGAATYSANEDAGSAPIEVILSPAAGVEITVTYATSNGTALAGSDYVTASGTLTFTPGQTSQSFNVSILNDAFDEADETVNLALVDTNAQIGATGSAALSILDNDAAPSVQFSDDLYNISESGGTATVTVTLSAASGQTVTVGYATSDDTATAGSDYTAASGTLTFPPLVTSRTFTVTILPDTLDEADQESVQLTLNNLVNATAGIYTTAALDILDNDLMPTVQLSAASYSVNEEAGTATITVTLSTQSGRSVSVHYATSGGTATPGTDYIATDDTLIFAPGQTSQTFTLTILPDLLDESNETVGLTLSNENAASPGTPMSATLTIVDNDYGVFLPVVMRNSP